MNGGIFDQIKDIKPDTYIELNVQVFRKLVKEWKIQTRLPRKLKKKIKDRRKKWAKKSMEYFITSNKK